MKTQELVFDSIKVKIVLIIKMEQISGCTHLERCIIVQTLGIMNFRFLCDEEELLGRFLGELAEDRNLRTR